MAVIRLPCFIHSWDGCICSSCGEKSYSPDAASHSLENCVCVKCGMEFHQWDRQTGCTLCGKEADAQAFVAMLMKAMRDYPAALQENGAAGSRVERYVRELGKQINELGGGGYNGREFMRQVCAAIESNNHLYHNTIQRMWDGIGMWVW